MVMPVVVDAVDAAEVANMADKESSISSSLYLEAFLAGGRLAGIA